MTDKAIPEADADAIRESIFAGRKIEAIKQVRAATGLELYQAKKMVEKLEEELRATSPEKFTARPGKGCSTSATALVLTLIAIVIWVIAR